MSAKTIVISVPKTKNFNVIKQPPTTFSRIVSVSPPISTTTLNLNNPLPKSNAILSPSYIEIKDEPMDGLEFLNKESKPPRKRQRLDHLTVEQKVMRR